MAAHLTLVDAWAAIAAAIAGAFLALRSNMLKPSFGAWADAGRGVRLGLFLISVVMGGAVLSILQGAHANAREAVTYTALAIGAVVMFLNLHSQAVAAAQACQRPSEPARRSIRPDVPPTPFRPYEPATARARRAQGHDKGNRHA